MAIRGIVAAGLSGGSGKSVVTVGLAASLNAAGVKVAPFKKGPDYIDAEWLRLAAGYPCHNLDPYLMDRALITDSCRWHAAGRDFILAEGNRGLFDGVDSKGSYSTAELAATLGLPVLLVVDCTKTTRTVAALVMGCVAMGEGITLAGVVLNRIGSSRHERVVRQAVERYTGVPVLGAVPRLSYDVFPQRHIGVTPCQEYEGAPRAVARLGEFLRGCVDVERVVAVAGSFSAGCGKDVYGLWPRLARRARVGVIRDAAFQFYYPENLRALERLGAELVEINALEDTALPDVDGLYIGGGFPETAARRLADNESFRRSLRQAAEDGLPVYAECGGLIFLCREMEVEGTRYPLAGVFPVALRMEKKPQAHGYTILETAGSDPFYPAALTIKGHEFRYSKVVDWDGSPMDLAFAMKRGKGFAGGRDGLARGNTLALYTHVHALATPEWATAFMERVAGQAEGCRT